MIFAISIVGLILAFIPAAMFLKNVGEFQLPDQALDTDQALSGDTVCVSVLIPARDEAGSIRASVGAATASTGVTVEVVVMDDHSTDDTAAIVQAMSVEDPRVKYCLGKSLPDEWNGKQHACWQLAKVASYDRLVFLDADVRLTPQALRRLVDYQDAGGTALLSAFPHQETGTFLEKLVIPMMHFILLGYLPFSKMRGTSDPAFASGCGQLFMTRKSDYETAGTHAAIAGSRHDGLKLPRAYRQAGLTTDVVDGTDLADCRMYDSAPAVVRGVLKNATEGIANPRLIVVFTVLLLGSSVLPLIALVIATMAAQWWSAVIAVVAVLLGHLPRAIAAIKFRQSWLGVIMHAFATLIFIVLQWIALAMHFAGRKVTWRGRT